MNHYDAKHTVCVAQPGMYKGIQTSGSPCCAGVANLMYAHQTYVPAPVQQSAPILSVDRMSTTAHNLEQTVPMLHEAHTAKDILVGAYHTVQHQVGRQHLMGRLLPRNEVSGARWRLTVLSTCLESRALCILLASLVSCICLSGVMGLNHVPSKQMLNPGSKQGALCPGITALLLYDASSHHPQQESCRALHKWWTMLLHAGPSWSFNVATQGAHLKQHA